MPISIQDFQEAIRINIAAGLPVMGKGASGIGKTDATTGYVRTRGPQCGLFELNAATANLPDVMGVLMPQLERWKTFGGSDIEITSSRYSYPYFMRDKFTGRPAFTYDEGVVVIEEYGQADADVKRGLASLIWEKRLGEHRFPDKCGIVLLSNRPEDRSGVQKDFDFLINRRVELDVVASLDGWIVWAHDNNVSSLSLAYASRREGDVFANKAPKEQGPWLTPRSLVSGDKFLKEATDSQVGGYKLDDPFVRENLTGIMGKGHAHQFIALSKLSGSIPTITAIANDPHGTPVPPELDQQWFLVYDMAAKAKKDNIRSLIHYMKRLPSAFAIAFYKSAMKRDSGLRSVKEFGDWAVENQDLMAAINA